jgi:predicted nuclease with TOPRIM domain
MNSRCKAHRYQRFLETVLEVADEYQEVPDLLMRHATLQATNQDLKEHQHRCAELAEKTRAELNVYIKQKTDEILNLNNHLARLKKELESFEQQAMAQESKKDYSLQVASQKTLEYGQVVMSTDNIFNRCRSKSCIGHAAETHPLLQLEIIGNYVSDLGYIVKMHKEQQRKAAAKLDEQ